MWRYEELLDILRKDPRFEPYILAVPFKQYLDDEQTKCMEEVRAHFSHRDIQFVEEKDFEAFKRNINPDIIFYQQPYQGIYNDPVEWKNNADALLVTAPYCIPITRLADFLNQRLFITAWRYYVPTSIHQEVIRRKADNYGRNTVVSGELLAPRLLSPPVSDPWKEIDDGLQRKRIIWAPHFSINNQKLFERPDFNWSHTVMMRIATELADKVQIAFKPHPRLLTEMYAHPDWGKERADEFYAFWQNGKNTQLVTGEYLDLFKTSDAMIHNCGSFTAEYMWMDKPVGYLTTDIAKICNELNDFGLRCQEGHYTLSSADDIERFIRRTVIEGDDTLRLTRHRLMAEVLNPDGAPSAAEIIYHDLLDALSWTY